MTAGSRYASFPIQQPGLRAELSFQGPAILESNASCLAGWLCAAWASSLGAEPVSPPPKMGTVPVSGIAEVK